MKQIIRVGFLCLAVGMVAALALALPAPTRAGNVGPCSDIHGTCAGLLCELAYYDNGQVLDHYYGTHDGPGCLNSPSCFNVYACLHPTCGDDRVNTNCSAPEIVYCNGDDVDFYKYNYSELKAFLDFSIPLASLQQSVATKTLIKHAGTVSVYLMPDGRVLLVAQQTDGKDYFMFWDPSTCASIQEGAEWNVGLD